MVAMTGGLRRLRGAIALFLACAVLAPAAASAQAFLEAYRAGVDAVERGDWATAQRLMEEATDDRPEAAPRLLRHLQFKPYVPWYYLGLARYRQGDCTGALEAWTESERQAVAPAIATLWQATVDGREDCQQRIAAQNRAARNAGQARQELDRAEAQAQDAAAHATEARAAGVWTYGNPAPADLLASAQKDLAAARKLLQPADGDQQEPPTQDAVDQARSLTRQALGALEALRERLAAHRAEIGARRGSAVQRLNNLQQTARRALAETEDMASRIPSVARDRDALSEALQAADAVPKNASLQTLEEQRNRLARAISTLRETAAPPPEPLLEAAGAFFSGQLEHTVELLNESGLAESPDPRTRAHAALLRAAARFSLWQAGGGADLDLLEAARQDVRTARDAAPVLTPLPRAFSPRFLAFFEANPPN